MANPKIETAHAGVDEQPSLEAERPYLDRLAELARLGWLGPVNEGDSLVAAAMREIEHLRAGCMPPSMVPDESQALLTAFGVFWQAQGARLADPTVGSHQARFEAFCAGVASIGPAIAATGRALALASAREAMLMLARNAQGKIDALLRSVPAGSERSVRLAELQAERSAFEAAAQSVDALCAGGATGTPAPATPEQRQAMN